MNENIVLSKETISRLIKDVKEIIKTPLTDHGIHYIHDETDILKGQAMIIGPKDTPYENGFYLFNFTFPQNYPHSPPIVKYCTNDGITRFNPNLYKCGKVCLSVLNTWRGDQWTGCQTISSILLVLCTVLNETPLLNEPGITKEHKDYDNYNEIITYKNFDIAIIHILSHPSINEEFSKFMPFMQKHFIDNFKNIIEKISNHMVTYENTKYVSTGLYTIYILIKYSDLHKRMLHLYHTLSKNEIDKKIELK
jgi:ubiquitin-protein ligase